MGDHLDRDKVMRPPKNEAQDERLKPFKMTHKGDLVTNADQGDLYPDPEYVHNNPFKTPPNNLTSKMPKKSGKD